jgi:sec-independent protein translocase protein TatB
MLDFAWSEFILVALVALVFLGPKELILLFKTLGQWVAKLKAMQKIFMDQVNAATVENAHGEESPTSTTAPQKHTFTKGESDDQAA